MFAYTTPEQVCFEQGIDSASYFDGRGSHNKGLYNQPHNLIVGRHLPRWYEGKGHLSRDRT